MVNIIPIFGWLISVLVATSMAVPFYVAWTVCGIGGTYFYFLPQVWQTPSFFSCIGIFVSVSIIKVVFVPRLASVSQTAEKRD